MGELEDQPDPPREWYGAELKSDDSIEFLLENIGPVEKEMRMLIYDLFTYYGSNGSRTFVVFEYDFNDEEIVSYFVLPHDIFEKMWFFSSMEYDVWNEVERVNPIEDPEEVKDDGGVEEWTN